MADSSFYFDINGRGLEVFLGPTEARLMDLAWRQQSLTVKRALALLGPPTDLAYTTVMTVLNRLTGKGLLNRSRQGRSFVYAPRVQRDEFVASRVAIIQECLRENFPESAS